MSIESNEKEIIEEFEFFEDWTQRYEHIIELGKSLPLIDPIYKTNDYTIKGCQSQVWLHASLENGKVIFTADSDAIITKGIISLLVRVLSNQTPQAIVEAKLEFLDQINLKEHLSPTRSNGLVAMIKQMKMYAVAFM